MSRSLLDTADLAVLREAAQGRPAPAIAAALIDTGLLQFDPDDPAWADRDRLVLGGQQMAEAFAQRLGAAGAELESTARQADADALGVALGAGIASALDGGIWRAWCAIDEVICDDGRTWEAARAATGADLLTMTALVAGADSERLWRACGWSVEVVPADDPAWLLGALDQAMLGQPTAVLVHE